MKSNAYTGFASIQVCTNAKSKKTNIRPVHSLSTDSNRNNNILVHNLFYSVGREMKSNAYTGFASIQVRTNAKAHEMYAWAAYVSWASKQHNNVAVGLRQCCLLDAKSDAKKGVQCV